MSCDAWVDMDNEVRWRCYTCGKEFNDCEKWESNIQAQHSDCRKSDNGFLAADSITGFIDN